MPPDIPSPAAPLRIGTRGSPLALWQAHAVRDALAKAFALPDTAFAICVIKVHGDQVQDQSLRALGGKGLFTREIEEALLAGEIDIAVHSMKDMPTLQPPGLVLDCYLPRADVRDAFLSPRYESLSALPKGARVGSSSLRRRAQIAHRRPDLELVEFRGNLQTRLKKLEEGLVEATFLAAAGLERLGLLDQARGPVPTDEMLPAVAQGAIGVERRAEDSRTATLLAAIHDAPTGLCLAAERAFLAALDGSCATPIAGLATLLPGGQLRLEGEVLHPEGRWRCAAQMEGPVAEGTALGARLAAQLLAEAPGDFRAPLPPAP